MIKVTSDQYSSVSRISFRGGGGSKYFGKRGEFAWQSHAFARGFGGMLPRKKLKVVQFGAFWREFC